MSKNQIYWKCRSLQGFQDGGVLTVSVYIDESGTHDSAPFAVVGGAFARDEVWQQWTDNWIAAKSDEVKIFHAVDCHNFQGEFKGWTKSKRDEFVKKMLDVTASLPIYYFASVIELAPFRKRLEARPDVLDYLNPIHQVCAFLAMRSILNRVSQHVERAAIYIEESQHDNKIRKMASKLKEGMKKDGFLFEFVFGGKNMFEPLQAADILVYEVYKQCQNLDQIRRPILVLDGDNNSIWSTEFLGEDASLLAEDFITLYDEGPLTTSQLHFENPSRHSPPLASARPQ